MSPSERREFKQAHRQRSADILRASTFAAIFIVLVAFHADALMWAFASWLFIAWAVLTLLRAGRDGEDMASEALRARAQEAQARENTRPLAEIVRFPEPRP